MLCIYMEMCGLTTYWTDVRDLCGLQSVFPRDRKVAVVED